jgi:hypothetical protein
VRGQREIKADESGHLTALRWARSLGEKQVWAIEDCRHVSCRLEQALLAAGERVVRVTAVQLLVPPANVAVRSRSGSCIRSGA